MRFQWSIAASDRGITDIRFIRHGKSAPASMVADQLAERWRVAAQNELHDYFAGRLTSFASPYDIRSLTPFTRSVLRLTAKIPYGEVRTYEWLARKLGKPQAARAVGNALARNPVPILIPCHRVFRSDGVMGGFALGRAWKKRLLNLEKRFRDPRSQPAVRLEAPVKRHPGASVPL